MTNENTTRSGIIPHHYPTETTEKILQYLMDNGGHPRPAAEVADALGMTTAEIVSATARDMRTQHHFRADQQYWILPLPDRMR